MPEFLANFIEEIKQNPIKGVAAIVFALAAIFFLGLFIYQGFIEGHLLDVIFG